MNTHLIDEKFLKDKPEDLLIFNENFFINLASNSTKKGNIKNLNFNNSSESPEIIAILDVIYPIVEKIYKGKTFLKIDAKLKDDINKFLKSFLLPNSENYIAFFTSKKPSINYEINSENFDFDISDNKVTFYFIIK